MILVAVKDFEELSDGSTSYAAVKIKGLWFSKRTRCTKRM